MNHNISNRSIIDARNVYRYTITFKTTWEQHTQVQDISNESGGGVSNAARYLLELGIEKYNGDKENKIHSPKQHLFGDLKKARDRHHILALLSEVKPDLTKDDFASRCQEFGIDPSEVEDIIQPGLSKGDFCQVFLKALFTDRPEGMSPHRVTEIGKQLGFGENLVRKEAKKLNILPEKGTKPSIWYPPESW